VITGDTEGITLDLNIPLIIIIIIIMIMIMIMIIIIILFSCMWEMFPLLLIQTPQVSPGVFLASKDGLCSSRDN
jgi:hypothetical protein